MLAPATCFHGTTRIRRSFPALVTWLTVVAVAALPMLYFVPRQSLEEVDITALTMLESYVFTGACWLAVLMSIYGVLVSTGFTRNRLAGRPVIRAVLLAPTLVGCIVMMDYLYHFAAYWPLVGDTAWGTWALVSMYMMAPVTAFAMAGMSRRAARLINQSGQFCHGGCIGTARTSG